MDSKRGEVVRRESVKLLLGIFGVEDLGVLGVHKDSMIESGTYNEPRAYISCYSCKDLAAKMVRCSVSSICS